MREHHADIECSVLQQRHGFRQKICFNRIVAIEHEQDIGAGGPRAGIACRRWAAIFLVDHAHPIPEARELPRRIPVGRSIVNDDDFEIAK